MKCEQIVQKETINTYPKFILQLTLNFLLNIISLKLFNFTLINVGGYNSKLTLKVGKSFVWKETYTIQFLLCFFPNRRNPYKSVRVRGMPFCPILQLQNSGLTFFLNIISSNILVVKKKKLT